MSIIKNLLHNQRKLVKHSSKQFILSGVAISIPIGHVNNIPRIQFLNGILRSTQSKSYVLSLTEYVWEFKIAALWDTLKIAL